MSGDAFLETYRVHLDLLGVNTADLQTDGHGTIRSRLKGAEPEDLPELAGFQVGDTLGQGGMGLVSAAWQHSLDREVAVKGLRGGRIGDSHRMALVHEARITGQLEHPNVVPIHDLGVDHDGDPIFVMKRIDGLSWSDWLESPDADQRARMEAAGGPLAFHIDVLIQVCNAVSYAHSRGILHRDLKPPNVMIGNFGEVYLVDWGIAARLEDLADGDPELVGTPAYMAPEMAAGRPMDPRADVYQLGAMVFEAVAGYPPRPQATPMKTLALAWSGEILPIPEGCPDPLAAVILRALAPSPDDRYPTVAELQGDLRTWLRNRPLLELAAATRARVRKAIEALAAPSEASLVIREARNAWAALDQIRTGLEDPTLDRLRVELVSALLDFELARQRPGTAEALLIELGDEATEAQRRAVEQGLEAEAARSAELERLRDQQKWTYGREQRQWYTVFLGVFQAGVYFPLGLYETFVLHGPIPFPRVWIPAAGIPALVALGIQLMKGGGPGYDTLGAKTMRALMLTVLGGNLSFLVCIAMGFDLKTSFAITMMFGLGLPLGIQAVFTTPRYYPTAALFAAAGLVLTVAPRSLLFFVMPAIVGAAHMAFYWSDTADPDEG